jgi:hypothetical protein
VAYLHAAAQASADMSTVARWVRGTDPHEAEKILTAHQAPQRSAQSAGSGPPGEPA